MGIMTSRKVVELGVPERLRNNLNRNHHLPTFIDHDFMSFKPNGPRSTSQLDFHRPKIRWNEAIPTLSKESRRCLQNLARYHPPKPSIVPRSRSAAVLVALFVGRQGDLYVLLSRRSSTLRTYAGDTSLPGGKVDPEDRSIEDTARREAFEEIGLPRDRNKVPLLCILEPFLAAELIVTPVVVLILDYTLRPILNRDEVASLFSHPLASFLSSNPPFPHEPDTLEVPYHKSFDFKGSNQAEPVFRVHQFLTGREAGGIKPVFGLTAAMLIRVATVGYARQPDFEVSPPHAPSNEERIAWALLNRKVFRDACERDGVDLRAARRVVEAWDKREARRRRKEGEREGSSTSHPKSKL